MSDPSTSTDLYHEVRGQGPLVVLIPGAFGDAGQFHRPAERLADEFTVVTYDRRGFSRSLASAEAPESASLSAQADDAAQLVLACGFDRAVVFGTSFGADIVLELVARHPDVVLGAVVHEPPLRQILPPMDLPNPIGPVIELARTDPAAAVEAMVRTWGRTTAGRRSIPKPANGYAGTGPTSSAASSGVSSRTSPTATPSARQACRSSC